MCCSSPFPLSAETVAAFLLVLSYLGIYQPDEEQTENGEDEQHNACVEIVTFHAAPHLEHQFRAVAEVAYHGAAFHYSAVRILYRVYLQAVGSGQGAEEVAEVGVHVERGIGLGLHDFRCGYGADSRWHPCCAVPRKAGRGS